MNQRDLERLLRRTSGSLPSGTGETDFSDSILSKLPGVRFVIPGSLPGRSILVVAGILGLATAAGISFYRQYSRPHTVQPPPSPLFQSGAVEPRPVSPLP